MNKYQIALDHIIKCDRQDGGMSYLSDAYRNDISTLSELVERATPKNPKMMRIKKYDGYNIGICECGNTIDTSLDDDVNFCPKCGQAIDWSDEEWKKKN